MGRTMLTTRVVATHLHGRRSTTPSMQRQPLGWWTDAGGHGRRCKAGVARSQGVSGAEDSVTSLPPLKVARHSWPAAAKRKERPRGPAAAADGGPGKSASARGDKVERHSSAHKAHAHDERREEPVSGPQANNKGQVRHNSRGGGGFNHAWCGDSPRPLRALHSPHPNNAVKGDSERKCERGTAQKHKEPAAGGRGQRP